MICYYSHSFLNFSPLRIFDNLKLLSCEEELNCFLWVLQSILAIKNRPQKFSLKFAITLCENLERLLVEFNCWNVAVRIVERYWPDMLWTLQRSLQEVIISEAVFLCMCCNFSASKCPTQSLEVSNPFGSLAFIFRICNTELKNHVAVERIVPRALFWIASRNMLHVHVNRINVYLSNQKDVWIHSPLSYKWAQF